jgi:ubiquinone/menaquinone biosynthesis C-methylase UbiE
MPASAARTAKNLILLDSRRRSCRVPVDEPAAAYDRVAAEYERGFVDELEHKQRDQELLAALAQAAPDGPAIDVGCGPGQIGAAIRSLGRSVVGIDLSAAMAARAGRHLNGAMVGDMRKVPVRDSVAGLVVAFYAIIHVPRGEVAGVFREFARVLMPGGRVLVSAHEGEGDVTRTEFLGQHLTLRAAFFSIAELEAGATAAGFEVVDAIRRPPYSNEGSTFRLYLLAAKRAT